MATGASSELDTLRKATRTAVDWACGQAQHVGVLVPGTPGQTAQEWSLQGFGLTIGDGPSVDLPVAIARWLLNDRPARVVGVGGALESFDALLVMGDGSSSRTEKAPGHLDPQAIGFDDAVLNAVATGDPLALGSIDLGLAEQVGAAGASVWQRLGALVGTVESATLDAQEDRYGVLYFVARWTARWAAQA